MAQETTPTAPNTQTNAWYDTAWGHVKDTWKDGTLDLYVPAYTWHLPWAYSPAKVASLNNYPAGAGFGLSRYNESGNWEGMFAMAFADSHSQPQYATGYGWIPTWTTEDKDFRVGVGLEGFITARADIGNYTPIPGILPVASVGYKRVDIQATYVPGGRGFGNVVFIWTKIKLD